MLRPFFWRRKPSPSPAAAAERAVDPRLPDGLRIYAIGDVHGCADLLHRMTDLIAADLDADAPGETYTVFLGDYVDRGGDSAAVLDRLSSGRFPTAIVPLIGNHEQALIEFLESPDALSPWRAFGGLETMRSYGVEVDAPALQDPAAIHRSFGERLPAAHRAFLRSLGTHHEVGDYFFCHAGVRPGVALADQTVDDLTWIRDPFLDATGSFGKVVVHGHTPTDAPVLRANRIGIDTGAYATGRLTCLRLERDLIGFITAQC